MCTDGLANVGLGSLDGMWVYNFTHTYLHMHACTHIQHTSRTCVHTHTCTRTRAHTRTHTYVYMYNISIELHTEEQVKQGQQFYEKLGTQAVDNG